MDLGECGGKHFGLDVHIVGINMQVHLSLPRIFFALDIRQMAPRRDLVQTQKKSLVPLQMLQVGITGL